MAGRVVCTKGENQQQILQHFVSYQFQFLPAFLEMWLDVFHACEIVFICMITLYYILTKYGTFL